MTARRPPAIPAGAACQDDPELFYPNSDSPNAYDLPKQLCRACPERTGCLDYALTHDERYGVWGGLSPTEREELRTQRRRGAS